MTHLSERQAWLVIAEAYATPYNRMTELQLYLTDVGCCNAVIGLCLRGFISHELLLDIKTFLEDFADDHTGFPDDDAYFYPTLKYHRSVFENKFNWGRADFCYFMAYACEDD